MSLHCVEKVAKWCVFYIRDFKAVALYEYVKFMPDLVLVAIVLSICKSKNL